MMCSALRLTFVPRLSTAATDEFLKLSELLADIVLTDQPDVRMCPWEDKAHRLSSSAIYKSVVFNGAGCEYYKFIWENCASSRVKFFGWLLVQNRIQTKENLLKKHCVDSDLFELCGTQVETVSHLIAGCPFAAGFWQRIGINLSEEAVSSLWQVQSPVTMPAAHFNAFLLLCCWRLWNYRHDVVFRSMPLCYARLFAKCREDAELLSCRLSRADRHVAQTWASMFPSQPSSVPNSNDM
ncbi:hypothetical protein EJB05_53095, partial [Eragrostis curvula]